MISCIQLFVTLWTVAHQAPLSTEFSSKKYWGGLLFPSSGDLSNPGIEPESLVSPELACEFFTTWTAWEALKVEDKKLFHFDLITFTVGFTLSLNVIVFYF